MADLVLKVVLVVGALVLLWGAFDSFSKNRISRLFRGKFYFKGDGALSLLEKSYLLLCVAAALGVLFIVFFIM